MPLVRPSHQLQIRGGAMSDLVEKVARAIRSKTDFDSDEIARAAIKAMAEWIGATGYTESEYWADVLKERAANE